MLLQPHYRLFICHYLLTSVFSQHFLISQSDFLFYLGQGTLFEHGSILDYSISLILTPEPKCQFHRPARMFFENGKGAVDAGVEFVGFVDFIDETHLILLLKMFSCFLLVFQLILIAVFIQR